MPRGRGWLVKVYVVTFTEGPPRSDLTETPEHIPGKVVVLAVRSSWGAEDGRKLLSAGHAPVDRRWVWGDAFEVAACDVDGGPPRTVWQAEKTGMMGRFRVHTFPEDEPVQGGADA